MSPLFPVLALSALVVVPCAFADPDTLGPPGWSREVKGALTQYNAPNGQERVVVREITSTDDPLAAAQEIVSGLGARASDCALQANRESAMCDGIVAGSGFDLRIRAYAVRTGTSLTSMLHMGLADAAGLESRFAASGDRIAALATGNTSSASSAPAPAPIAAPPAGSGKIDRVLFDLSYVGGIGGAVYPKYTPVYLFRNGEACRCADLAPGDVDTAALRRARPEDVGQWRKAGGEYAVQYADGDTDELDPSVGPPAPIPGGRLNGRYGALGGGGNTALGGSVMVIASEDYDFRSDGTFYQETFGGGGNGSVTAGSTRGTVGKWRLDGATLSLEYPDGRTARTSVYWDSKGDLVNGSPDVLWIGGDSYTLED